MEIFLSLIGFLGFVLGIIWLIINLFKKKQKKKPVIAIVTGTVLLIIGASIFTPSSENTSKNIETQQSIENLQQEKDKEKEARAEVGKETISALESNDFLSFVEEYKKLGSNKTPVWDNYLYGKTVTWTGTVVRAGTSQLFVYGGNDYQGESWDELGDQNKLFYTFVAKYADGTADEFKKLKTGDTVTVQGTLESRGDYDLNYNWKIYDATLKEK
jgi:ABC-type transport system involved in multi-copper enzyme maturation permease subunit